MAVYLKDIKRSLERDLGKVGKRANGDYKYTPPNIVARKLNNYPSLPVSKSDGTPNFRDGSLMFTGLVQSQSSSEKYKVFVKFAGVPFFAEPDEDHSIEEQIMTKGKIVKMYRAPVQVRTSPVAMRCSCKDFQHRFAHELAAVEGLVGQPIKYVRKTPAWPLGNPYANSTEKIGICKHLWSFLNELNRLGMVGE